MTELRYACRRLRRHLIFSTVAVITIGIAVGATVAIFSLLYQLLLRPLPYANADRLVFIWNSYPKSALPQASVSIPDYLDRVSQAGAIEAATLFTRRTLNLGLDNRPEQLRALAVTPSFFGTLGRQPERGRVFLDDEAKPGADHVVILANTLWRSRFAADPTIVGQDVRLSGEVYRVVGVLPPDFELPSTDISLLVPFAFTPEQQSDQERGREFSQMVARLAPGASIQRLESEMAAIIARNLDRLPRRRAFAETSGFRGYAVPIRDQLVGDVRTPLYLLQAAALVVLLIAAVNVANLMLMRASARQHELAVCAALGAERRHLVRGFLAEGFVIAAAGTILGLLTGVAMLRGLVGLAGDQLPVTIEGGLHAPQLLVAAALAIVIALLVGAVPTFALLREGSALAINEESGRTAGGRRSARTHGALVIVETALALTLLTGAGLLVKSYAGVLATRPGFSPEHVMTATVSLPAARYAGPPERLAFWTRLVESVRALPGVTAVGLTSNVPLSGNVSSGSYSIVGYTPGPGEAGPHGRQEVVGGDYFRAMEIPLVEGRFFDERDGPDAPKVTIVDQYLVARYFKGRSPIGQQIRLGGPDSPAITIVGVVGTVNAIDLAQPVDKERLYYPATQAPVATLSLMVKTAVEPPAIVAPLHRAVQGIDPEQPLAAVRTMDEWMSRSLMTRRAPMLLFSAFGVVALVLAAIGTYGVMAYGVSQRTKELGIRQALGASGRAIVTLIMGQGLRRASIGVAVGLLGALALARVLRSQLVGVGTADPVVLGGATVLLLLVTATACALPAWRATTLEPSVALRQ